MPKHDRSVSQAVTAERDQVATVLPSVMVLADLGRRLNGALSSLNRAPVVDEKVCIRRNTSYFSQ